MGFASDLAQASKIERALVLGLAAAETLVEAGERVGLLGLYPARSSRRIAERFAEVIAADRGGFDDDLPPQAPLRPSEEAIIVSDFLSLADEVGAAVDAISANGARGHLLMIVDPVEETFPFQGQAVLHDLEDGLTLRIGDAASWGGAYLQRIAAHRDRIREIARGRGWTVTLHRTDRPASEAALRLLTLVSAGRAGAFGGGR
jgi:uncharacterized protein (DUF58 family)